jgi:Toastrack DUF4097
MMEEVNFLSDPAGPLQDHLYGLHGHASDGRGRRATSNRRSGRPRAPGDQKRVRILLMALLLGVVALSGCGAGLSSANHSKGVHMFVTMRSGVFSVTVDAGSLHLISGPSGRVSLRGAVTYRGGRTPRISWEHTGNEVWLHSVCGSRDGDCRYDYTIFVPMSTTVFANDAAGDIWAKGLAGSLGVNAAAGNVTLAGISGPLRVTIGAGNVVAAGLRSATTDVEEGTGNVTLGFTAAPVDLTVRASTGNVSVVVPRSFSYRVSTSDQLGEVSSSVADDPSSSRAMSLSVGTGNIFVNQFSG